MVARMLGLPESACFTDARAAFKAVKADFCTVVVPPNYHEAIVDIAIEHGVDVLSEKPIADTMEASVRIAKKIKAAGRKMAVTMSHRFDQDKTTLRRIIRSGKLGRVNNISCRYQADMRQHMAWGALFRHTMQDPMLIEGAIHHLDIVADLAGAKCETLFASTWKPDWAEYAGDTDGVVTMVFENGVRAVYEGSSSTAVGLNDWYQEYIRVDCEFGTAILNGREIEVFTRQDLPRQKHPRRQGAKGAAADPAEMDQHLADRAVHALARRRPGDGDQCRGERAGLRADLRFDRELPHQQPGEGAGVHRRLRMTPAERVRLRLREASGGRGFLVGAAIGTGLAAQAATRGGADFLLALNAGRIRSMGEPSAASLLALRDTNRFVPEFAIAEIRPRTDIPVFVGAAAFDPGLDVEQYLAAVAAAGFEGITNFPTVVLLEGRYRRFLEASGYGFDRELALLAAARERGLATLAYAHTREEARRASAAGVDIINIDLGWNTGGALGVSTRMRIEEAAELAQSIVQMVRRRAPRTFLVIEGGPIVSPEQADAVCRATDIDGYVGGSTIDRVPLETAMELVTSAFKTVGALRRKVSALERQLAPQRWPAGLIGAAPSVVRAQAALERALAARSSRC